MKFFRDSYRLTVSACEHFCTNHIGTTVYIVVYTVVGLSSSFVYHKNQFYRSFFGGFPACGGSGYPLQLPSAISASIPNPYAGLTLPVLPLLSAPSLHTLPKKPPCPKQDKLRLLGFIYNILSSNPQLIGLRLLKTLRHYVLSRFRCLPELSLQSSCHSDRF